MPTDTLDIWQTAAEASWDAPAESTTDPASSWAPDDETTPGTMLPRSVEPDGAERYVDRGPLGRGGMGEVRLVWDRRLGRLLARKILFDQISRAAWERFTAEARLTARLDHPGMVPVYDFGVLEDGRPWFTMKRIEGQTLTALIQETGPAGGATGLRRIVGVLLRAAEAVAFAHSQGVLHRDIKPDNIMVGALGQIYVVDWGIARLPGADSTPIDPEDTFSPAQTRAGAVFGTPTYMAPEQAAGQLDNLGTATDVYGLGATLWHILAGCPPHADLSADRILDHLRTFPDPPSPGPTTLGDLRTLCLTAMAPRPADRPADAAAFAAAVSDWLDGVRRQEEAMTLVGRARALLPRLTVLRQDAANKRAQAEAQLAALETWRPVADKAPAWALQDAADALEHAAELAGIEATGLLRSALVRAPDLAEAHALLAEHYQGLHAAALDAADTAAALRYEALLRRHDQGAHRDWLSGLGALSLTVEAPEATVVLHHLTLQGRRLQPDGEALSLPAPVRDHSLPAGSYLAHVTAPSHLSARYPLRIPRGGRWSAGSVRLLTDLGKHDHYVPAGPAILGNPDARNGLPRRTIVVPGFVMRRHPVTNREFLAFLNHLVTQDRAAAALTLAPREHAAGSNVGKVVYHQQADGTFFLGPDSTGDTWDPEWPVVLISREAATAWCAWEAARTGKPWRLPWEFEREKAAVGADGRRYPWGDAAEPTWSRSSLSQPGRGLLASVTATPADVSPYGIEGLTGNCRDWCLDARTDGGPAVVDGVWHRPQQPPEAQPGRWWVVRGGAWSTNITDGLAGSRLFVPTGYRRSSLGFRAAYSVEGVASAARSSSRS